MLNSWPGPLAEKSDRPAATEFGLRKMWITRDGSRDPVFGKLRVPLVPTLHGESFTVPAGATELAFGYMLCRDGKFRRQSLAFRFGISYAFQFEPQLTLDELRVWNRGAGGGL